MQSFKTSIIVPICSNNLFIQFRHNFIRSHKIWKHCMVTNWLTVSFFIINIKISVLQSRSSQ